MPDGKSQSVLIVHQRTLALDALPLPDNPAMHLLIPFAHCQSPDCATALQALTLPNLQRLLQELTPHGSDSGDVGSLSPPHERALALALGLTSPGAPAPDGQLPWGAWHAARAGLKSPVSPPMSAPGLAPGNETAWAVITPVHWAVQTNHITMSDPEALQLGEDESRSLLAAMLPYFSEDGIRLVYDTPTRWLASGAVFRGLATASVDRVVGRRVDDWLPKTPAAKPLRRLQQEMQMLLYTHPLTDARAAQGQVAVNSFWVSGTGALGVDPAVRLQTPHPALHPTPHPALHPALHPTLHPAPDIVPGIVPDIVIAQSLRSAALREDWPAWAAAWQQLDASECAACLAQVERGDAASITLCGERGFQRFDNLASQGSKGALRRGFQKLMRKINNRPTDTLLSML
jgi:hypothetical protein